ncbi:MAG: alanine--tRNA ligase [Clostridiales bacterium]|jgi:alanyl-tRNA synthetase|nr:alanine--tRNA ligase [Clostridiales bacterium]
MQKIGLNELRERFLAFFEGKGHLRMHSFPLIPKNDRSLLLINSGMAPLKPYFTGAAAPPDKRVTTCQKCIRTPDIENVGKTDRHGTFFEMLGNFSFGDYFKREAILWAWEFFTQELGLPRERLYPSVFTEDDEAYGIWRDEVGLPESHVVRLGKEDNFWEHGLGPCGPSSEIYFDRGPEKGCGRPECAPGCDCDRYIEVWNLVFTQFDRKEDGSYERLAHPNIDTGMGLERLACVMQGVDNLFEVDTIRALLDKVCGFANVSYKTDAQSDVSIRVITDHIRSTVMMAADGVVPSNEGRGYVLRRLLRRAARHGRLLGIEGRFLSELSETAVALSGGAYPELLEKSEYIKKVISVEEGRFAQTLDQGLAIFREYLADVKAAGRGSLGGDLAFKLHDTYGFPLDLTREIAEEEGVAVDEAVFREKMEEQRAKARSALKAKDAAAWGGILLEGLDASVKTEFVGYETMSADAAVLGLFADDGTAVERAAEGETVTVVLDRTPFYAESGGQQADTGRITVSGGEVSVFDCKKTENGVYLHLGEVTGGSIARADAARAELDAARRRDTEKNHTATHLLQAALKRVLGDHVNQSGSLVGPEKLRFDFNHFEAAGADAVAEAERLVNEQIFSGLPVTVREMDIETARGTGAQALFGEKYGDVVRVVSAGAFSREFCGGTHVENTREIGLFVLLSESGVAAGIRRIEALTGGAAYRHLKQAERVLSYSAALLKASPNELPQRIAALQHETKEREREIERLTARLISGLVDEALSGAAETGPVLLIARRFDQLDADGLRGMADSLREREPRCVALLASGKDGRVGFVAAAGKAAVAAGVHAGNLVKAAAAAAGGGGGGRPDMAQAGGKDPALIEAALAVVPETLARQIKK